MLTSLQNKRYSLLTPFQKKIYNTFTIMNRIIIEGCTLYLSEQLIADTK
jgi:hypothetical protein